MRISLKKANLDDCDEIQAMQSLSFKDLLETYQDYETNPGMESVETIEKKLKQEQTDYYFIVLQDRKIGVIRVVRQSAYECRISPMFILPENQGNGYGIYGL